jgi:hypothetical protein
MHSASNPSIALDASSLADLSVHLPVVSASFSHDGKYGHRSPSEGWARYPNLRLGATSSRNKGRGRLQQQVRRAFVAAGVSELTSSAVM